VNPARFVPPFVRRARRGRVVLAVVLGAAVLCWCGGLFVISVIGSVGDSAAQDPALIACQGALGQGDPASLDTLDEEQRGNGELIVEVGVAMEIAPRAWVIAVATAMQESRLRNLDFGDRDSLGLFQQRPSMGWGTPAQIMDPEYASTAFYERLLQVENWQQLPLTEAAQAVQRSAYPDAYAKHEPLAVAVVNAVAGGAAGAAAFDGDLRCAGALDITAAGWTRPAPGPVWSGFRTAARPDHHGIDIGAPRGTQIRAAADGVVTLVTCNATLNGAPYSCDVDGSPAVAGCGWYVNIRHGDVVTRYCHQLTRPDVSVGQTVAAGQPIGVVGSSGRSSGPHLHFEVELSPAGGARTVTDPIAFMAARGVVFECGGPPVDCQPASGDQVVG
jgi:murein DD-endopeptidase MepM/ murein hydrolase activator NlpD